MGLMQEVKNHSGIEESKIKTQKKSNVSSFHGYDEYDEYDDDDDDDSNTTDEPLTSSESDDGSMTAEGEAWSKGKSHGKKTRGCCTVNVTTTFVPHVVRLWTESPARRYSDEITDQRV